MDISTLIKNTPRPAIDSPPAMNPVGFSRIAHVLVLAKISREKFRLLAIEGRAPQPIRLSKRCTVYRNSEIISFCADPLNFRAELKGE